jgi:hypothetical protein
MFSLSKVAATHRTIFYEVILEWSYFDS